MATTGSITSGSNQLVVADVMNLRVGNSIIVEIGGETGTGARGTIGVGGAWPALSYANTTAMNADTSQALNKMCWVVATGDTYYWDGAAWVQPASTDYYIRKAVPKALWAEITAISGNTLTLSKTASATATNANVYFDNWGVFQALVATQQTVSIPAGTFYFSDFIFAYQRDGITIQGAGQTATRIKTPRGCSHGGISVYYSDNATVRDLEVDAAFKNTGFGLRWANGRSAPFDYVADPATEFYRPTGYKWGGGVVFYSSVNGVARNVTSRNVSQHAVACQFSENIWAYNCKAIIEDPLRSYIQWLFQWADITSENAGGCVECEIDSEWYIAGFEAFKSRGVSYIRCTGRNAVVASNSSDGLLFEDLTLTLEDERQYDDTFSINTPIININQNVGGGFSSDAITFTNLAILADAANAAGRRLRGLVTNNGVAPVIVTGTYPSTNNPKGLIHQRAAWDGVTAGDGVCLDSNNSTVTMTGMRFKGEAPGTSRMVTGVGSAVHTITNCVLDPGSGSAPTTTETGTLTNAEYDAL